MFRIFAGGRPAAVTAPRIAGRRAQSRGQGAQTHHSSDANPADKGHKVKTQVSFIYSQLAFIYSQVSSIHSQVANIVHVPPRASLYPTRTTLPRHMNDFARRARGTAGKHDGRLCLTDGLAWAAVPTGWRRGRARRLRAAPRPCPA